LKLQRIKKSTSAIPMVDLPSQPRRAIVFSWRAFASSSALHIFRFAGSSQANQHVTRRAKGRYLACENFIETIIVAHGSEQSAIACETNGRITRDGPWIDGPQAQSQNVPCQPRCRHFRIQAISFRHADIVRLDRQLRRIGLRGSKVSAVFPSRPQWRREIEEAHIAMRLGWDGWLLIQLFSD
jgi:hypothetical protein